MIQRVGVGGLKSSRPWSVWYGPPLTAPGRGKKCQKFLLSIFSFSILFFLQGYCDILTHSVFTRFGENISVSYFRKAIWSSEFSGFHCFIFVVLFPTVPMFPQ